MTRRRAAGGRGRWPGWVYDGGHEPDHRFSFANERTFLAWIRTALALVAAGVAVDVIELDAAPALQRGLSVLLVGAGLAFAVLAWVRWARSERAMRRGVALPSAGGLMVFGVAVVAVAAVLALLL
ncbi:Inner membrane protein YidH [Nocardioides dokdonensis FR1436]|uniref:Inner membrane protein YidH n=1 Tax=Nocardioides dokdonensis FR1436 TaxID=1300347 RepID=A0A1A9GHS8_9ACTN|nr:DUF202 domain-containing protein [Nocardioides dokdonensis]ANH37153.1 Inner membrane protein YidH [Nocardioides dokdonensis FR1436]